MPIDLIEVDQEKLPTLFHQDMPRPVPNLLRINKCPDLVQDRGHTLGRELGDEDKEALIAYLKTL